MADKGKSPDAGKAVHARAGGGGGRTDRPSFIEGYLNASDKEWLRAHYNEQLQFVAELLNEVGDAYVCSVKFDADSQRFKATLTCRKNSLVNANCILVSRGATSIDALYALAYRHYVKFAGEWGSGSGDVESEGLWD